jgi:hypothetical protein
MSSDVGQRTRHHRRSLAIENGPEFSAIVVGHYEQEIDFLVRIEGLIDTGGYPLDVLLGNFCPDFEDQKAGSGRGLLNDRFGVCRRFHWGAWVCTPTNRQILLQFRSRAFRISRNSSRSGGFWQAMRQVWQTAATFGLQAVVT